MAVLAAAIFGTLSACARDGEESVRSLVGQWFFVGKTLHFQSRARCTLAVFRVTVDRPRPELEVAGTPGEAKAALRKHGISAIRMESFSPHDLTEEMLLSGEGTFGKEALHAGALAKPCLGNADARDMLFAALTRPGATLAYESGNEGVMILDATEYLLFYVAGDVW